MSEKRRELVFQGHIIDSYKGAKGYARKWASEWQVGVPDLICSLRGSGGHLMEVKHRPNWCNKPVQDNPLEPKQQEICKDYMVGGCLVLIAVVAGGEKTTKDARLFVYPAYYNRLLTDAKSYPYNSGSKFDVYSAIRNAIAEYDFEFARSGLYFKAQH